MMERMKILAVGVLLAAASAMAGAQDKKAPPAGAVGPYELPALDVVKDKCKTSAEQNTKLEVIYKDAGAKEAETKKLAKDNGTDRKDLEKFLAMGKIEIVNKVKEVLDDTQDKIFDQLVAAALPDKKKKK